MPRPDYLPIGTRVRYSERAASVKRRVDSSYGEDPLLERPQRHRQDFGEIVRDDKATLTRESLKALTALTCDPEGRRGFIFPPPMHQRTRPEATIGGKVYPEHREEPQEMDRWTIRWPEEGEGFVTGLVYRQTGKWDSYMEGGGEYEPGYPVHYLSERFRQPFYAVRKTMTGREFLVPVDAIEILDERRAA